MQGGTPGQTATQNYGASDTRIEQYGAYGQLRFSPMDGLTATGGGRLTWWETTTQALRLRPARKGLHRRRPVHTVCGTCVDVTGDWNVYGSYADSFTPQAAPAGRSRPDGKDIEPLVGAQYEVGTKLSLMDDRLLLSGAAYQIEQTNRLFNDPDDATVVLQVGKVRARGVEAEAAGEILPGWRINGGYSYTRTKYIEDANAQYEACRWYRSFRSTRSSCSLTTSSRAALLPG
ncbi:TonB-dependent siderophore receptor [Novosphingobium panipatense]